MLLVFVSICHERGQFVVSFGLFTVDELLPLINLEFVYTLCQNVSFISVLHHTSANNVTAISPFPDGGTEWIIEISVRCDGVGQCSYLINDMLANITGLKAS